MASVDGHQAQRADEHAWPEQGRVLVLAPHPDDFDAIGVTLHWLMQRGHRLDLVVLTSGSSGVDDGFGGAVCIEQKTRLREREQLASCRLFGLPEERCHFLRLWQEPSQAAQDFQRLTDRVLQLQPNLVFMPHGNDSNATHRHAYQRLHDVAREQKLTLSACLNQDAKTLGLRPDLYMPFNEAVADWKAQLLRCHTSQQERNLRTRAHGFDERVLQLNREMAKSLAIAEPYAEVFEVQGFVDGQLIG
jgi:LmbE family N-acetylglucosaminyl deacetylase